MTIGLLSREDHLTIHPAADLLPMMLPEELAELAESIKTNGQYVPIVIDGDTIIDGRNRLAACKLAGVEPKFEELGDRDPLALIAEISARRNMTKAQRAMHAAFIWPNEKGGRGKKGEKIPVESTGISDAYLVRARSVLRSLPDVAKLVLLGTKSLDEAVAEVRASQSRLTSDSIKLDRLRAESPDLAELVKDGKMRLDAAIAVADQRIVDERNARRSATRALNSVLAALEPGESTPEQVVNTWIQKLDFSAEPYPLPLTRQRLEGSLHVITGVILHLMKEA